MQLPPKRIFKEYHSKKLDCATTINFLISIIENGKDNRLRIESLNYIKKINPQDKRIFKLLENIIISDTYWNLREVALNYLIEKFESKSYSLLRWLLDHEEDLECIIPILNSLAHLETIEAKKILKKEIKKIYKKDYIGNDNKGSTNRAFKKEIKKLLENNHLKDLNNEKLADIILNYKIIAGLKKKFFNVYYKLEEGLISVLDLSDIEFEVRGWKSEFNNSIESLDEIIGLRYLKSLKKLYLDNNQITDIKALVDLKMLSHLYLPKNRIDHEINITYLNKMAQNNLEFVDITGNRIANSLQVKNISKKLKIKYKQIFH